MLSINKCLILALVASILISAAYAKEKKDAEAEDDGKVDQGCFGLTCLGKRVVGGIGRIGNKIVNAVTGKDKNVEETVKTPVEADEKKKEEQAEKPAEEEGVKKEEEAEKKEEESASTTQTPPEAEKKEEEPKEEEQKEKNEEPKKDEEAKSDA